jgi:hypothetical protein
VASDTFTDAAAIQAEGLGLDVAGVFVAHPIQDRTDDEMATLADDAIEALLAALTGS